MSLIDILRQYAEAPHTVDANATHDHFDQVAQAAPPEVVGQGVADAFKSNKTPAFGEMVAQLFAHSDPTQRAGVLNQLLRDLGPALTAALGGSTLGKLLTPAGGVPQVSPNEATQVTPEQVRDIAARAEQHDPTAADRVGSYYGQHPDLVKKLGTAALAIALAGVARRLRK